jgi:y4mF family transcriptional regulator
MSGSFSAFVKDKRRKNALTQPELAKVAGVGLRFVRDLEQGKVSLRLDKVNQVLALFGHEAGPVVKGLPAQPKPQAKVKTKPKATR